MFHTAVVLSETLLKAVVCNLKQDAIELLLYWNNQNNSWLFCQHYYLVPHFLKRQYVTWGSTKKLE